ncbi:hypothetical protein LPJ56_003960 [Coemansia sp. RSA 2599]|nr:hypothetical protein LPJ56_003960 [Coemansia sp. RSA 2599]
MSSGPGKLNTVALHPISQVHFRLSQRPPTSQKKARLSIDHAESIEDEDLFGGIFTAVPDDDLDDLISRNGGYHSSESAAATEAKAKAKAKAETEAEAEAEASGALSTEKTSSRLPFSNISNLRNITAGPAAKGNCTTALSPISQSPQLRKSTLQPSFRPMSAEVTQRGQQRVSQCTGWGMQTLGTPTPKPMPASPSPSPSPSLLRPVSAYQHSVSSQSHTSPTVRRPLLSQRPAAPSAAARIEESVTHIHCQPGLRSQTLPSGSSPTPNKRHRKEGAAVCELRTAVSRALSEYNVWFHRLDSDPSMPLAIPQPIACARVYVRSVEAVVLPHLFRADAEISSVPDGEAVPQLKQGQSLTVILSLAVCSAAAPHAAKAMHDRLSEAGVQSDRGSAGSFGTGLPRPLFIDLYHPLRLQNDGDGISILASRFQAV